MSVGLTTVIIFEKQVHTNSVLSSSVNEGSEIP